MIRHLVLFRFRADATAREREAVLDGLVRLPSLFPAMRRFGLGENVSGRDQTCSHAMSVEFDDRAALESYLDSEAHERFVAEWFRPHVDRRAIARYDPPSDPAGAQTE